MFFETGIVLGIVIVLLIAPTAIFGGAPYVPSPRRAAVKALLLARLQPGETLVDLGCGDGRVLRLAASEFGARAIGVEMNLVWVWVAGWLCRRFERVQVIWGDMSATDLSQADVVYLFLSRAAAGSLAKSLPARLKPGCRVVSYGFPLLGWEAVRKAGHHYVYELPESRS